MIIMEEQDNLLRSNKKVMTCTNTAGHGGDGLNRKEVSVDTRRKTSFRGTLMGTNKDVDMSENLDEKDGDISDDDVVDDDDGGPCFSMGMTKVEKKEARRPSKFSAISILVVDPLATSFYRGRSR